MLTQKGIKCCSMMQYQMNHKCALHNEDTCPERIFILTGSGKLALRINDGGGSYFEIQYCPFCGASYESV